MFCSNLRIGRNRGGKVAFTELANGLSASEILRIDRKGDEIVSRYTLWSRELDTPYDLESDLC